MLEIEALDTHSTEIAAGMGVVWEALAATLVDELSRRPAHIVAVVTGVDRGFRGPSFPEEGARIPGFLVAVSIRGERLRLEGRHRFSEYALDFRLVPTVQGTRLSATTHAIFPGRSGALYRELLLRSRGHRFVVRRLLRLVRDRAAAVAP